MPTHDVIVVGARAAGAATALLLARLGHDVLVVDRAELPSDTISTHQLARTAVVALQRWGLLDDVIASGAPAIRQVVFHSDETHVTHDIKPKSGVDCLVAPRRHGSCRAARMPFHLMPTACWRWPPGSFGRTTACSFRRRSIGSGFI